MSDVERHEAADEDLPAWSLPHDAVDRISLANTLPARVDRAWALDGATGAGIDVCILDSGVEAAHPQVGELASAVSISLGPMREPVVADDAAGDLCGHGTACAGVVRALAPEARLHSVRVLGAGFTGSGDVLLAGLRWAVEQRFDVINLSLGTNRREWALPFYEICDEAYFRGCLVVTAANNVMHASYPSLFGSVASVACNLTTDPFRFHYNPEPPTEFLARGIDVDVLWRGGSSVKSTGNSYAAPHIAGIAALIRSKHPELRPFQIKTALWATAANVREAPRAAGRLSQVMRPATTSVRATSALRRLG